MKHTSIVTTGSARTTRLSPRDGLTAYFELFPVSGLCCHRRLADTSANLGTSIAAPEPHDFAVRPGVFVRRNNSPDAKTSIASRAQRFVTIAKRPSCGRGTGGEVPLIWGFGKAEYFFFLGLTIFPIIRIDLPDAPTKAGLGDAAHTPTNSEINAHCLTPAGTRETERQCSGIAPSIRPFDKV